MSLIDSEAAFKTHCDRVDSSGGLWQILRANELKTFSALGFAIGTPQRPPSEDEFREFSIRLNAGTAMSMGESARLRRVHFEACTMYQPRGRLRGWSCSKPDLVAFQSLEICSFVRIG